MKSLSIKNFKNIKNLEIDGIERVNLFTGKNNTGKSSLLEAVALYVNEGDLQLLKRILEDRGEVFSKKTDNSISFEKQNIDILSSLFTNHEIGFNAKDNITIKQKTPDIHKNYNVKYPPLHIRLVKYYLDRKLLHPYVILEEDDNLEKNVKTFLGLELLSNYEYKLIPLNEGPFYNYSNYHQYTKNQNFQYIKSGISTIKQSSKLWDNITLTEKETNVIEGLKIIEPSIERLAFIGKSHQERTAVVKLKGNKQVVKLQGMGDGINRILSIILAAVNAENGYLLIDEFENGLHYSVQQQLWEIIFKLASELNIQVFATTHSNDCIDGFEEVLNSQQYNISGKLYRLEKDGDTIKNIVFDKNELKIATEADIETR